jgi:hypothetical protein
MDSFGCVPRGRLLAPMYTTIANTAADRKLHKKSAADGAIEGATAATAPTTRDL